MIWKRKARDPRQFKRKFALFPVCVDDVWVWLEHYDTTGWYYEPSKDFFDLIKTRRYPSRDNNNHELA